MHNSIKTTLALLVGLLLFGISSALAFSFDFGDDDDDWWRYAYWGNPNQPWVAPNGMYFYPRLPYFQRHDMVDRRQQHMAYRANAMDELAAMLYGRLGFDRAQAIKLARGIESTSGTVLMDNFHPGAVATYGSRTTLALWQNQDAFRANALALQAAAKALAEEFEKQPSAEEGAVFLPQRTDGYGQPSQEKVAVSPRVWEKYNAMTGTCDSCHRGFRGYDW
ncbi:MAG: cytochrome c [Gammaproteobacteria bacterium]|nr:cytochrome c [Gammaproteobacteria bacterium]